MSGSIALYEALKSVNVSDSLARAAAADIYPSPDQIATKADLALLRTEIATLRVEMAQQGNRIVIILSGVIALAVALVKFLPSP